MKRREGKSVWRRDLGTVMMMRRKSRSRRSQVRVQRVFRFQGHARVCGCVCVRAALPSSGSSARWNKADGRGRGRWTDPDGNLPRGQRTRQQTCLGQTSRQTPARQAGGGSGRQRTRHSSDREPRAPPVTCANRHHFSRFQGQTDN